MQKNSTEIGSSFSSIEGGNECTEVVKGDRFLSLHPCLGVSCRHPRDGGAWEMNAYIQVAFDED